MKNLFKKKSQSSYSIPETGNPIKDNSVIIDGKKIKPVWNDNAQQNLVNELKAFLKEHPQGKYMNMHHANFAVYYAILEGANQQNIDFPYYVKEVLFYLGYEEYGFILMEIQKSLGVTQISDSLKN